MGKSLQPLNAIAVRQPANTPPAAGTAATTPAPNEPVTAESLGWQLRAALPPLRLHSVSLYDEEANVLWLSEGALGPDEHSVVVEAIEALSGDSSLNCYENGLEDGRIAIFLPVRSPQGALVGIAMILADVKSVGDGVVERLVTPQIRTIMQKVAVLLRPAQARNAQTQSVKALELASEPAKGVPASSPPPAPRAASASASAPASSQAEAAAPILSPQAVNDILEFELTPNLPPAAPLPPAATAPAVAPAASIAAAAPAVFEENTAPAASAAPIVSAAAVNSAGATGTSRTIASATGTSRTMTSATGTSKSLSSTSTSRVLALPEGMSLSLEVQPFSKLRAGGRMRRFEVIPRSSQPNRVPAGFDKIALQHLLTWMAANRAAWSLEPASFTLNLSIATLEDERFPQFVASNLKSHGIAADNIGFEIAEPLCLQRRAQVERFITLCDKLGCFVVIDDFSLDSSVMSLLRSKSLRLVKIDSKLTSVALKDKLAQAMVVAIAQAVKVLGIHCAAKRVDAQASLQWLTAIGCDFAQGSALAHVHPIEALGMQPPPAQPA